MVVKTATSNGLRFALCLFLIVPILTHSAEAASISCVDVKAVSEKPIYHDHELLRVDRKLSAIYRAVLQSLSAIGRVELRRGQREWLKYAQIVCLTRHAESADHRIANCLRDLCERRQKQLDSAVVRSENMVIRRVDRYSVTPSAGPGSGGLNPAFNTTTVSFPQIDEPRNEHERIWNRLIAQHKVAGQPLTTVSAKDSANAEDDEDLSVDYILGSVSPRMISLWFLIYEDAHGAGGTASDKGITWLLEAGRALRAEDVFDSNQPWGEALANLVIETAKREAGGNLTIVEPSDIVNQISDPKRWLIEKHALVIRFIVEDAPACCAAVGAVVPWRKLKPYLRSPLPFHMELD
jgi:uncharacterized protein